MAQVIASVSPENRKISLIRKRVFGVKSMEGAAVGMFCSCTLYSESPECSRIFFLRTVLLTVREGALQKA